MIRFKVSKRDNYVLVEFELERPIEPADLKRIIDKFHKSVGAPRPLGIVLSGRGPIWLYAALVHECHPWLWVATYDPRQGGAVIVESHSPIYGVGDVILLSP